MSNISRQASRSIPHFDRLSIDSRISIQVPTLLDSFPMSFSMRSVYGQLPFQPSSSSSSKTFSYSPPSHHPNILPPLSSPSIPLLHHTPILTRSFSTSQCLPPSSLHFHTFSSLTAFQKLQSLKTTRLSKFQLRRLTSLVEETTSDGDSLDDKEKRKGFSDEHRKKGTVQGESVNLRETRKFEEVADMWWDAEDGPFAPLHSMSPVRVGFIRAAACAHFGLNPNTLEPLAGVRVLDVGCGGGMLSEPLARLGACVLGLDAVEHSVDVARRHKDRDPAIKDRIMYRSATAESLVRENDASTTSGSPSRLSEKSDGPDEGGEGSPVQGPGLFDVVCSLEVIEHVNNVEAFVATLANLTRPGGMVIMSTLNRSLKSYLMAIVGAEHILRWVPVGTHDWSKFVSPEEIAILGTIAGLEMKQLTGMVYNPIMKRWHLDEKDVDMNYIAMLTKPEESSVNN